MSEYKPEVGDLVDFVFTNGSKIVGARIKFVGEHLFVYGFEGYKEDTAYISNVIIIKHEPEPTTQELMLEDVNKALCDDMIMNSTQVVGVVFDSLVDAGWHK